MASLPSRPASQRRQSPGHPSSQADSSQPQVDRSTSLARSATSEDSQTLFLNSPNTDSAQQDEQGEQPQQQPSGQSVAQASNEDDPSISKCWICFADSTEDTPETSPWRDPCPCALTAHEECLLDWIADMEAPNKGRSKTIGPRQILCPQCKSEIHLARPRNLVVNAVRAIERLGAKVIIPGSLLVLGQIATKASLAHGIHSVFAIFGSEDGYRILKPLLKIFGSPPLEISFNALGDPRYSRFVSHYIMDRLSHWRLWVGLPLITPLLVLSRTTLADSVLPVLPILFFATQTHASEKSALDFNWPPSASLAFAILPYIRGAYNEYYLRVWAQKEKQWLKDIQPRTGQAQSSVNNNIDPQPDNIMEDADNGFEIELEGNIWDALADEGDDLPQPHNAPPNQQPLLQDRAPPLEHPPQQHNEAAPAPDVEHNRDAIEAQGEPADFPQLDGLPGGAQPQVPERQERARLSFSPTAIAETALGALLFPTIASLSGEALKVLLPRYLTASPGRVGLRQVVPKSLLQQKWGRSLVGGCLFVVLKDAVMLYVRWRMSRMHRERRVLDWDKKARRPKR